MQPGYVCVAGLDLSNGQHVRPVLGRRLGVDLLRKNGGVFEIGAIIDLGQTTSVGTAPEVEDRQFVVGNLQLLGTANAPEFWHMILATSAKGLAAIFGPSLISHRGACAVDVNSGTASLGCMSLPTGSTLDVDPWKKIRLTLR
jgi:hypothetical protein